MTIKDLQDMLVQKGHTTTELNNYIAFFDYSAVHKAGMSLRTFQCLLCGAAAMCKDLGYITRGQLNEIRLALYAICKAKALPEATDGGPVETYTALIKRLKHDGINTEEMEERLNSMKYARSKNAADMESYERTVLYGATIGLTAAGHCTEQECNLMASNAEQGKF